MMLDGVGGDIRIAARKQLGLHGGDLVQVSVIKRLDGNKWAVGINGRVFPAYSGLDLEPGSILRARVSTQGQRFILTITGNGGAETAAAVLARQGLSGGGLDELVASSLLRSGLPVTSELVEKVKAVLSRSERPKEKAARGLAVLADKGFDVAGRTADGLLRVFGFGERGGEDPHKYRKRDLPRGKTAGKSVKALVAESTGAPGALAVFNHLKGRSQSWIVIPFLYEEGADEYPGTIKLLYDPYAGKPRSMAVSVSPNGGPAIDFHLALEGRKRLSVFCGDPALRAGMAGLFGDFRAEFHNMGFEVDDTIHGSESFDGFSPAWEGASVRGIDTVG